MFSPDFFINEAMAMVSTMSADSWVFYVVSPKALGIFQNLTIYRLNDESNIWFTHVRCSKSMMKIN